MKMQRCMLLRCFVYIVRIYMSKNQIKSCFGEFHMVKSWPCRCACEFKLNDRIRQTVRLGVHSLKNRKITHNFTNGVVHKHIRACTYKALYMYGIAASVLYILYRIIYTYRTKLYQHSITMNRFTNVASDAFEFYCSFWKNCLLSIPFHQIPNSNK